MDSNAPRLPLRVQWRNARGERSFATVDELADMILKRNPGDFYVRRRAARQYEVLGKADAAEPHWAALVAADSSDFEAAFHIARNAIAGGASPADAAAGAAPEATECFRNALVDALAHPAPALEGPYQHIAICGAAFCGSTLVDRVLGGLPGVKSIGESHWLTKVRHDSGYGPVDWNNPIEVARWVPCTVCGGHCDVLSPSLRRALAADAADWYRKIAARLGTRILVSADKNLPKLVDHDPLLDLSALVIFKSPEQAWRSHLDKLPEGRDPEFYEAACRDYLGVWVRSYRPFLDHFNPQGEVVYLNFDAFTRDPEPLLLALCTRLAIPYDPAVLQTTVPGHAICGNGRSMRRLRDKNYQVTIEPLADPALEPVHAALIAANEDVQQTWRDLVARHNALVEQAASGGPGQVAAA
jgi:hypothetical protein